MNVYPSKRIHFSMNSFLQNTTPVRAGYIVILISSFAYNLFGEGPIMNCFYFVTQLLSSDGTACALFVVSFMASLAVYVTNTPRSKYTWKLPLLLVIVCWIISRNSIKQYTTRCGLSNVVHTLVATMTPTAYYCLNPRKAPSAWTVLFDDTICHYDTSMKNLSFNMDKFCILKAVARMDVSPVSKKSARAYDVFDLFNMNSLPKETDTHIRAAMGYYIINMQRHFICAYFGYLFGWFLAMMFEVYKTSINCQKNRNIKPKDMWKVTCDRAIDRVCYLWQWDTEVKVRHLHEFRLVTSMACCTVFTWAWVKLDIAYEPDVNTRVAWFSSFDNYSNTVCRLLASDPFVWFVVYYVLIRLFGWKLPDAGPVLDEDDDGYFPRIRFWMYYVYIRLFGWKLPDPGPVQDDAELPDPRPEQNEPRYFLRKRKK